MHVVGEVLDEDVLSCGTRRLFGSRSSPEVMSSRHASWSERKTESEEDGVPVPMLQLFPPLLVFVLAPGLPRPRGECIDTPL